MILCNYANIIYFVISVSLKSDDLAVKERVSDVGKFQTIA